MTPPEQCWKRFACWVAPYKVQIALEAGLERAAGAADIIRDIRTGLALCAPL